MDCDIANDPLIQQRHECRVAIRVNGSREVTGYVALLQAVDIEQFLVVRLILGEKLP